MNEINQYPPKGRLSDYIHSLPYLVYRNNVENIITLWACPDLDNGDDSLTKLANMYSCEKSMIAQLTEALNQPNNLKLDMFIIDGSAPFAMGQILNSIWSNPRNRLEWLEDHNVFSAIVTMMVDPEEKRTWQHNFLERYRKDVNHDPVTRAELVLKADDDSSIIELGLVSCGDEYIFLNLHTMGTKLHERLSTDDMSVDMEIRKIGGGLWEYDNDFDAKEYLHQDYNSRPAQEQFFQQQPLGRESIFQLELNEKNGEQMPSLDELKVSLEKTLQKRGIESPSSYSEAFEDVGNGAVIVSTFAEGSVILVWNGRTHVDINLFSFNDREELADSFVSSFVHFCGGKQRLQVALRDDFPRGIGRVVNFRSDKLAKPIMPRS